MFKKLFKKFYNSKEDTAQEPEVVANQEEKDEEIVIENSQEVEIETTEVETEETTEVETEETTEVETEATSEVETEATSEVETEATSEVETEATSEVETEATSEVETEATSEVETEATSEVETEATSEVETEEATGVETEETTEVETETEVETKATTEVTPEVETEKTTEVTPEVETEKSKFKNDEAVFVSSNEILDDEKIVSGYTARTNHLRIVNEYNNEIDKKDYVQAYFRLVSIFKIFYKYRDNEKVNEQLLLNVKIQVELFKEIENKDKYEFYRESDGWLYTDGKWSPKAIACFKNYIILHEKNKMYHEAIEMCDFAIELGYEHSDGTKMGIGGRKLKLEKMLANN